MEKQAEHLFGEKLLNRDIRFDLEAGDNFRMFESYEIQVAESDKTLQKYGQPLQLSLFEPVFDKHFDTELERKFAFYLDGCKALQWWHRVAARQQHGYYLRGWKRERIYPDFIAMASETYDKSHLLVFETKGEHLRDNPDTDYKQRVFETLESKFNAGSMTVFDGPAKGTFRLVFSEEDFPTTLASI